MIKSFTLDRLVEYVRETNRFVLPVMRKLRKRDVRYSNMLVVLATQIEEIIMVVEEVIKLRRSKRR